MAIFVLFLNALAQHPPKVFNQGIFDRAIST